MRLFVAIYPNEELREKIYKFSLNLLTLPASLKLVEKENIHISVTFLGEVDENELQFIKEKIRNIVKKYGKFFVDIGNIKLIPSKDFVRVIALSVFDQTNSITKIAKEIGGDFKEPHLTLARVKKISDRKRFISQISSFSFSSEKLFVNEIILFQSFLSREGPTYTILERFELA